MATPPPRATTRRTRGSKNLKAYLDNNNLRPVSVYMPIRVHAAISKAADAGETTIQALFTMACHKYYGHRCDLPPLVGFGTPPKEDRKVITWYADIDLHKKIRLLAMDLEGNVQQLVLSAVLDYIKDAPPVKALKIKTGYPPFGRTPVNLGPPPKAASVR